ncbi:hypothetical protein BASA60_004963 [Batrachochytrium salamandrivorans]|nr:hypothetical protein BASA60_004963 [Batrachochytrium salamandrivorans]
MALPSQHSNASLHVLDCSQSSSLSCSATTTRTPCSTKEPPIQPISQHWRRTCLGPPASMSPAVAVLVAAALNSYLPEFNPLPGRILKSPEIQQSTLEQQHSQHNPQQHPQHDPQHDPQNNLQQHLQHDPQHHLQSLHDLQPPFQNHRSLSLSLISKPHDATPFIPAAISAPEISLNVAVAAAVAAAATTSNLPSLPCPTYSEIPMTTKADVLPIADVSSPACTTCPASMGDSGTACAMQPLRLHHNVAHPHLQIHPISLQNQSQSHDKNYNHDKNHNQSTLSLKLPELDWTSHPDQNLISDQPRVHKYCSFITASIIAANQDHTHGPCIPPPILHAVPLDAAAAVTESTTCLLEGQATAETVHELPIVVVPSDQLPNDNLHGYQTPIRIRWGPKEAHQKLQDHYVHTTRESHHVQEQLQRQKLIAACYQSPPPARRLARDLHHGHKSIRTMSRVRTTGVGHQHHPITGDDIDRSLRRPALRSAIRPVLRPAIRPLSVAMIHPCTTSNAVKSQANVVVGFAPKARDLSHDAAASTQPPCMPMNQNSHPTHPHTAGSNMHATKRLEQGLFPHPMCSVAGTQRGIVRKLPHHRDTVPTNYHPANILRNGFGCEEDELGSAKNYALADDLDSVIAAQSSYRSNRSSLPTCELLPGPSRSSILYAGLHQSTLCQREINHRYFGGTHPKGIDCRSASVNDSSCTHLQTIQEHRSTLLRHNRLDYECGELDASSDISCEFREVPKSTHKRSFILGFPFKLFHSVFFRDSFTAIERSWPHWMNDSSSNVCFGCSCSFTLMNRRHHCRMCGYLFCHACTAFRVPVGLHGRYDPDGVLSRACRRCKCSQAED